MRKKWFDRERAFDFIWNGADPQSGIWDGDAAILASEFGVPENTAQLVLDELCGVHLIQQIEIGRLIVTNWPEIQTLDEDGP
jgi:hypothetical protein